MTLVVQALRRFLGGSGGRNERIESEPRSESLSSFLVFSPEIRTVQSSNFENTLLQGLALVSICFRNVIE